MNDLDTYRTMIGRNRLRIWLEGKRLDVQEFRLRRHVPVLDGERLDGIVSGCSICMEPIWIGEQEDELVVDRRITDRHGELKYFELAHVECVCAAWSRR